MIKTLEKINGPFCLALFDSNTNTLWLTRDRFGLSALFFTSFNGLIAFSSRAKGLLKLPAVSDELDKKFLKATAAANYRFWDTDSWLSPFQNIKQLPAGHIVRFKNEKSHHFLFTSLAVGNPRKSQKATSEEYIYLFKKAVRQRLQVANKPIFSLSGGLDSSSVAVSYTHLTLPTKA